MSIEGVDVMVALARVADRAAAALPGTFAALAVGQEIRLTVLQQLDGGRYLVAFRGVQQLVTSEVPLTVGAQITARVTSVGDRLTLRYVDSKEAPREPQSEHEQDELGQLAERHGLVLAPPEHAQLLAAAADSTDPTRMILSGIFLGKLGLPLDPGALQALYAAQTAAAQLEGAVAAAPRGAPAAPEQKRPLRIDARADSLDHVADSLAEAFVEDLTLAPPEPSTAGGDDCRDDARQERAARVALNSQDGGSVAYRYATLPLLIGGDLAELQVALFTPRREDERGRRVRRLVMTFDTPNLKQIRIEAKSVDERIAVAIDSSAPAAIEALARQEPVVRELLAQLGWAVEHVSYGVNVPPDRAARRIVDHVLASGTLDEAF